MSLPQLHPGDICERRDRAGHFIAVISDDVIPGIYMVVPIAVSSEFASTEPSAFHTIGIAVQGWLISTKQRTYRAVDLHEPSDQVEDAPLRLCRELFQASLEQPPERKS